MTAPGGVAAAGCRHEVYRGEDVFTGPRGRTVCPDCLDDLVVGLTRREKAALLGYAWATVGEERKNGE